MRPISGRVCEAILDGGESPLCLQGDRADSQGSQEMVRIRLIIEKGREEISVARVVSGDQGVRQDAKTWGRPQGHHGP
jgi:hypothetical protein